MVKAGFRKIDGVLLLDKPSGLSSNAALQRARRLFSAEKAGHTGTLDPMASGLLPVCFGEATKFSQGLLEADKTYLAEVRFGVETTTGDAEGVVTRCQEAAIEEPQLLAALEGFRGPIEQVPPMYSALKHGGRPLYALARKGVEVERAPRRVTIHELEIESFASDGAVLRVRCSKGTYVRTLAQDLGSALGCGAHLEALRRMAVGALNLAQSVTLEALERLDPQERTGLLLPPDQLVGDLDRLELDPQDASSLLAGRAVECRRVKANGKYRVYSAGRFLGLGSGRADGMLVPLRLVASGARGTAKDH